jgi:nickel/cobalt exporter
MSRLLSILLLAGLAAVLITAAAAPIAGPAQAQAEEPKKDYFGRRAPAETPPATKSGGGSWVPGFVQDAYAAVGRWQRSLNEWMASEIRSYKETGKLAPALLILLVSFLYGLVHAIGPGHGKFITTSYFLANRARMMHGIALGSLIAFIQAISAIVLVGIFAIALGWANTRLTEEVVWAEMASYALIVLLGLYILWGGIVGRGCNHTHVEDHIGDAAHDHSHTHDHAHAHTHAHTHGSEEAKLPSGWAMLGAGIAGGIRPCTGAILVLLFTLAQGIVIVGILATFVMALGVAITISTLGMIAIFARKKAAEVSHANTHTRNLAHRVAGLAGGLIILVIGGLLLLGTLERTGIIA